MGVHWSSAEVRNTCFYMASRLIANLGQELFNFSVSLFILSITGSGTSFALSLVIGTLPKLLFSVQAGILSDRFSRKAITILMDISSGIVILILLIYTNSLENNILALYVANFFIGAFGSVFNVAMNGAVPNLVNHDKLTELNSWISILSSFTSIIAPLIGGLMYSNKNLSLFFLIGSICFFLAAFLESFIVYSFNVDSARVKSINRSKMKDVILFLKANSNIAYIILLACLLNFLLAFGYSVPMPFLVNNYLNMTSAQYGILRSANTFGALISASIMSVYPKQFTLDKRLIFGVFSISIVFILYGIIATPYVAVSAFTKFYIFLSLFFIFAFVLVLINIPLKVIMQKNIPNQLRGKSLGLMYTIMSAATPIGQIVAGVIIDKIAPFALPIFAGLLLLFFTFFLKSAQNKFSITTKDDNQ